MSNDTRTIDLVINNLTEEQFENVFSPDPNELWLTPDDTPEKLAQKVDKTSDPNKIYGTDAQGNQTTYPTPTIPTVNNSTITIKQGGVSKGSFTLNQSTGATIALDAGGGGGGGAVDSVNGKTGVVVLTATDVGALPDSTVIPDAQIQSDWNQADNTKVDFIKNKPTIPAAQVNSDWNANSGIARILNKPTIPRVNNPTITIKQGGVTKGSFTLNQATGATIALDAGGGSGSGYHPDLFDVKWADHELNDVQWLRADTYSWQSGAVYQAAYAHLVLDIDGKTLQSETISGTTIQFYLADDGHKICPASEESNVSAIYNATGAAWYYIIDTTNQRFKLPRELPITDKIKGNGLALGIGSSTTGYTEMGLRSSASSSDNYLQVSVAASATSIGSGTTDTAYYGDVKRSLGIVSNPDKSGIISHRANENGKQYLYFYVGNFTQTALENTAGLNAELFNQKADLNLLNTASNIDFVVERQEPTAANNYTWYRKYKSGWVEQGGIYNPAFTGTKTFAYPVEMADTNYTLTTGTGCPSVSGMHGKDYITAKTTTGFSFTSVSLAGSFTVSLFNWQVSGMAA